jgi:hypothetical protein
MWANSGSLAILTAGGLLLFGVDASCADNRSTDLIENCRSQANDFCFGYLSGFAQAANLEEKRVYYCFPEDASAKQLVAVFQTCGTCRGVSRSRERSTSHFLVKASREARDYPKRRSLFLRRAATSNASSSR